METVVCHAVFLLDLRSRHLEVTPKLELAVDDVVDGIRAPRQRVVGAATRPAPPAPLVGEQDLGSVVVECRRVPVGETFVDDRIDTLRSQRIRDVKDDAVARTGPGGNSEVGKGGDVVTLIGLTGLLRVIAVISASPQTRQNARFRVGEHGRTVNDARLARIIDWNLDDVDSKQCGPVVPRRFVETALHLGLLSDTGDAGVVDDDLSVFARTPDDRVRVRSATGLDRTHLHGPRQVADVENADSAEAFGADVIAHALESAVDPSPGLLHRHDQKVAYDGHITLPSGADD